ncbi:MAG: hypothetical protein LBT66_08830 [Methanobrevibacter sp.]|jgi:hypothetical protein|nr:hypothetical protein [Candidatus Methanovirga meridionalis]
MDEDYDTGYEDGYYDSYYDQRSDKKYKSGSSCMVAIVLILSTILVAFGVFY